MERTEIIKALECHANGCKCSQCPMPKRTKEHHSCWTELSQATLSLIKELTEKDEKVTKVITDLMREGETYLKQRDAFQNRVKYLEKENARLVEDNHILATEFKDNVKADTVRKMQERLLEELYKVARCRHGDEYNMKSPEVFRIIDQIAKEMLEGV